MLADYWGYVYSVYGLGCLCVFGLGWLIFYKYIQVVRMLKNEQTALKSAK